MIKVEYKCNIRANLIYNGKSIGYLVETYSKYDNCVFYVRKQESISYLSDVPEYLRENFEIKVINGKKCVRPKDNHEIISLDMLSNSSDLCGKIIGNRNISSEERLAIIYILNKIGIDSVIKLRQDLPKKYWRK